MNYVAVIGTGTMAAGIAAGFIEAGLAVTILGRSPDKAKACLDVAIGLVQAEGNAKHRCGLIDQWIEWDDCIWVVETIAEDLALKQALFRSLDERVPAYIPIGSNSSAYPISKIAEGLKTAERMMGAHYFKSVNKKPVLVKKDIPGFLANRIQHALMREALHLIDAGIASPEDVDDAVRYSFGFRYAAVGPITQKELSGWDVSCHSAKEIYPTLCNSNAIPQSILDMVIAGKSGVKTMQGYWQWTPEKVKALKAIYSKRLKAAFAVLKMES